jgi:chromate transporter
MNGEIFLIFLKVGASSFGGGPAAIALLKHELVGRSLLSAQDFGEALALGSSLPGPIVTNIAVFAGLKLGGAGAAAAAVAGALLPPALLMGGATLLLLRHGKLPVLQSVLAAIRPVVIALLALALVDLAAPGLATPSQWVIFGTSLALLLRFQVHPGLVIIAAGLAGALLPAAW